MASVNKVIIVGNLGRDPETRYNPEGGAITNISVATTDTWKDKASGEKQERTEWHRVVLFSRQGSGDAGGRERSSEAKEPVAAGEGMPAKKPAGKFDDMDDDIPF